MDVDVDNDLLSILAAGDLIEQRAWPALRSDILARLDQIAKNAFPIPNLPPLPRHFLSDHRPASPPLSPSSDKPMEEEPASGGNGSADSSRESAIPGDVAEPSPLPKQIDDMLVDIKRKIESFEPYPPHTIQRLAELILSPTAHYKALASWLHAVDRTVQVTSGTNVYPLPPPIPDMSSMRINGDSTDVAKDPTAHISWANPATTANTAAAAAAVGSDEALGGALLTPIPWLTRRSPEPGTAGTSAGGAGAGAGGAGGAGGGPSTASHGAQIHSEGTETIYGPNGMGSIETVSVSVNGVPSMGHARGVTQGELLRQEQRAGVVPVSQLTRHVHGHGPGLGNGHAHAHATHAADEGTRMDEDGKEAEGGEMEVPHARGPEEIGVGDTGPQPASTSLMGENGGIEMQGIDVEAAVGRRRPADEGARGRDQSQATRDEDAAGGASGGVDARARQGSPGAESTSSKREAEDDLGELASKKAREDTAMKDDDDDDDNKAIVEEVEGQREEQEDKRRQQPEEETDGKPEGEEAPASEEDKMET